MVYLSILYLSYFRFLKKAKKKKIINIIQYSHSSLVSNSMLLNVIFMKNELGDPKI